MKKGIREVYTEINEQGYIFHAEMKLTLGLVILERKAYSAINEEYEKQAKFKRASANKKDKVLLNYGRSSNKVTKLKLKIIIVNIGNLPI